MKSNYKRLGDYIEEVEERNRDLSVKLSQGICNMKYFQDPRQVAENSTADKVVRKGWFAYNRATTRNGDKISIAYRDGEDCTVSASYLTFRIKDEETLNPYYLMMWFKRPEFDRYARFKSHGSAHEYFEWDEMCDVMLPVPPIEEQRKIVVEYQAVERRIENNRRLIATLEATAQTIYRQMFVDNIDPENLPEGWRIGVLGDIMKISSGKSLSDKVDSPNNEYQYPVVGASGIIGYSRESNQNERFLATGRVGTIGVVNRYLTPVWTADNVLVAKSDHYEYAYQVLQRVNYQELIGGGVQNLITQTGLSNVEMLIPPLNRVLEFENCVESITRLSDNLRNENILLYDTHSLLLSKLSKLFLSNERRI